MGGWLWGFWLAVWPNLDADAVTLLAGLVWHHRRIRRLLAEQSQWMEEELRQHRLHLGQRPGPG